MDLLPALSGTVTDREDAITVDGRTASWAQISGAAAAVARRLPGARAVAVHATPTLETVVAIAGALAAGVPAVPVPPDSGDAERAHLLRDSGAELVLGGDPALDWSGLEVLPVDPGARADPPSAVPAPDATGLILYTSGTTGPPKGAVLSRGALAAGLDAFAEALAWTPGDTLVHGLPLFHVHGLVLGVLGPLRLGSPVVHTGRPRPELYGSAAAAGGSIFFGVPTVWGRVSNDPAACAALRRARLLVSGSAALPGPVFAALEGATGHRPLERYGMTETLITLSARADGDRRPGVVGFPVRGLAARIDGDELQVRGPSLFEGYLGRPEATAAAFTADGWFRTGDVAAQDPDGAYRIVGRASIDLIKSGGYKIGAGEVEDALLAHPAVREAAVVGTPHDDLGEQVTAYVVAEGASDAELIAFVAGRLAAHKRPREIRRVEALPRNAMGKILKTALR